MKSGKEYTYIVLYLNRDSIHSKILTRRDEAFDAGYQAALKVRTLKEDQPLRPLFNLLFYHFNRSEPTYKFQRIKLLDVVTACNQLNVNALN